MATQPTPIVDKNGKKTTVHKKIDDGKSTARLAGIGAPKKNHTADDPDGSHAHEFAARLADGVASMGAVVATKNSPDEIMRTAEKMAALADSVQVWEDIKGQYEYLAESKARFIEILGYLVGENRPPSVTEASASGYKLARDWAAQIHITRPPSIIDRIRAEQEAAPKQADAFDISGIEKAEPMLIELGDSSFGTIGIHREHDGSLRAYGSYPVGSANIKDLSNDVGDVSLYLEENEDYINNAMRDEYGTMDVTVYPAEQEIFGTFSVDMDDDFVTLEELQSKFKASGVERLEEAIAEGNFTRVIAGGLGN